MVDINSRIECAVVVYYSQDSGLAPQVTYVQHGHEAESLVLSGKMSGIPIVEDNNLGRELVILDEGDYIPERLWRAVILVLLRLSN